MRTPSPNVKVFLRRTGRIGAIGFQYGRSQIRCSLEVPGIERDGLRLFKRPFLTGSVADRHERALG